MGVEFAFQCSGVLQTDLPTWSNTYGIVLCGRRGTTEWFMRAPRDACPGAQTCCASPTRTPARLANSRRTWSRRRTRKTMVVSAARICLRAQPLESSLGRVPQAAD